MSNKIRDLVNGLGLSKVEQIAYYYLIEIVMQGYKNGYCLGIEDNDGNEYEITVRPKK